MFQLFGVFSEVSKVEIALACDAVEYGVTCCNDRQHRKSRLSLPSQLKLVVKALSANPSKQETLDASARVAWHFIQRGGTNYNGGYRKETTFTTGTGRTGGVVFDQVYWGREANTESYQRLKLTMTTKLALFRTITFTILFYCTREKQIFKY